MTMSIDKLYLRPKYEIASFINIHYSILIYINLSSGAQTEFVQLYQLEKKELT
jgi:uncharacterized membrane protein YcgQ (UPF0703/DUF1980 family)